MALENSKKTRALELACGKPWRMVAREWKTSTLSQAEIAERWTTLVRPFARGVEFDQSAVSRIFAEMDEAETLEAVA